MKSKEISKKIEEVKKLIESGHPQIDILKKKLNSLEEQNAFLKNYADEQL